MNKPVNPMDVACTVRGLPRSIKPVADSFADYKLTETFGLLYRVDCYAFGARFSKVEGRPDLMFVRTETGKMEDEMCHYLRIEDARRLYARLLNLGFTAF